MLEVKELHKLYGEFHAVRGVTFDVNQGEIAGFLGPNGAGKTTTMKIITGFMLLGAMPFVLYLQAVRGKPFLLFRDKQVRWFICIVIFFVIAVALPHQANNDIGIGQAFRESAFNVISIMTGTGFSSANYATWGAFATGVFFFIMFIGG